MTIRDLLRTTLRLRPDRIILGEVRGGEAFDLLQALNTGHSGTLCTIHANSAQQPINRFTSCVLQSGVELPYHAIRSSIGDSLDLLLHIERHQGKRRVAELVEVKRFDATNDIFEFRALYEIGTDMETPSWISKQPPITSARLAVVLIHKPSGGVTQRFSTADRIASAEYQGWLRHMNAQKHEVYIAMNAVAANSFNRTKSDVAAIRHVYLDFDHDGTARVQAMRQRDDMPQPSYVLNTSPDKWQAVWKVEGFDLEQAERLMRGLVREFGADPAATDASRVMRLPGLLTINMRSLTSFARRRSHARFTGQNTFLRWRPKDLGRGRS